MKKTISVLCCFLLLFVIIATPAIGVYAEPENGTNRFSILIEDNAELLSANEEEMLYEIMKPISEYGNVVFVSIQSNPYGYAANYAENTYYQLFGNQSGTIFLIDMDTRELYIFSSGDIYNKITKNQAENITANVYRLASNEAYYDCAKSAFEQINSVLNNQLLFVPMRWITSILAGICISLIISIIIVFVQRNFKRESADITTQTPHYIVRQQEKLKNTSKRYSPRSNSSGGGGGSSGGGGGGGGGGHSF